MRSRRCLKTWALILRYAEEPDGEVQSAKWGKEPQTQSFCNLHFDVRRGAFAFNRRPLAMPRCLTCANTRCYFRAALAALSPPTVRSISWILASIFGRLIRW